MSENGGAPLRSATITGLATARAMLRPLGFIFPENRASLRLHQACGFRVVGVRERLGRLHGRWRDVLLLERRSPAIT